MLLDHGIVTEDLGGDTMAVAISARKVSRCAVIIMAARVRRKLTYPNYAKPL
jgi:hypothetical protein